MTTTEGEPAEPIEAGRPGAEKVFTWKRIVQTVISTAIVVGIFVGVMPQIANYGDVWDTIRSMTGLEIGALVAVGIWNLATYWFVMAAALPGMRLREAAVVNQASTAISNTLPGGGAIGVGVTVAMQRSWGFTIAAITRSTIVTGIWNNFVKLGMPVLALALLAVEGDVTPARLLAAAAGIGVLVGAIAAFSLMLRTDKAARVVGRRFGLLVNRLRGLFRKPAIDDWGDRAARFRDDTTLLLRRRWLQVTVTSVISHTSLYVVLLVALRNVGVSQEELSWIAALAAFAFVRLVSALPVTPGGVGVVELGYAAVMTIGMDDATSAQVVAAILLFRAITYALPIPFGAASYLLWRGNKSWRMSIGERNRLVGETYTT